MHLGGFVWKGTVLRPVDTSPDAPVSLSISGSASIPHIPF